MRSLVTSLAVAIHKMKSVRFSIIVTRGSLFLAEVIKPTFTRRISLLQHSHVKYYICGICIYNIVKFAFGLAQCFSTFVRRRPVKFLFHKTRVRSQQIYSSVPFQFFFKFIHYGIVIKSISTIMCAVRHVDKYKITFKLVINSRRISRSLV